MQRNAGGGPEFRGLLLDFGGVLTCSLFEQMEQGERRLGLPGGSLAWRGPLDPSTDVLWQAMQRGEISEREYWTTRARETGALLGEDWTVATLLRRMRPADPNDSIRSQAARTVTLAKRHGLRVGILSNELELFYGRSFLDQLRLLREVDCVVDATYTGILKPDPQSYELGLRALGTGASETLFVDDQPRNVAGAERAGLRTMLFDIRDPVACYRRIDAWLEARRASEQVE
ncbi:MAG TPA: HAD-IA family hydrolase [Burkholderiales bacterium]|nr:HAD-IA family hydrolase [Burkholderiales bacterium]